MKKKNKKIRIIAIIIATLIILVIAIAYRYGYFTDKEHKTNNINLGYNKIQVNENYIPPLNIEKGISYTKEPYITNIGNVECYVRVKSEISDSRVAKYLSLNYNEENFAYNEADGYWYYKNIVKPGERTESLFTTVTIAQEADDIVLDGFDIYVYAESVQTIEGKTMEETWNNFNKQ